jgi:hypothetical protein
MKEGTKTSDNKNIIAQLDEVTKVIFGMDVGENAHKMSSYGYEQVVNYINIEIQTISESGNVYTKWNYHIILDQFGKVLETFTTGAWKINRRGKI